MSGVTVKILVGHALDMLSTLPDESVYCAVTSPPYWGLRDYKLEPQVWGGEPACGHKWGDEVRAGEGYASGNRRRWQHGATRDEEPDRWQKETRQGDFCVKCNAWRGPLGLEPTPDLYVRHMVEVFREVRRVLRSDGTCWLNLGDCYASGGREYYRSGNSDNKGHQVQDWMPRPATPFGLKPKDLVGIPWRVAFALQADGWWLRSDIIWSKPNPMPESVTDRPTKAHEYLFLLAKSERYFYDAEAIKEPLAESSIARLSQATFNLQRGGPKDYGNGVNPNRSARQTLENLRDRVYKHDEHNRFGKRSANRVWGDEESLGRILENGRNKRTVWEIPTQPYPEAHFATFPEALVLPCIQAGTSEKGCCPECGAPWERVRESTGHVNNREPAHVPGNSPTKTDSTGWGPTRRATYDWWSPCGHGKEPVPCTILDPFAGSGTTLAVAAMNGRNAIGIELQRDYVPLIRKRLAPLETDLVHPAQIEECIR